MSSPVGLVVDWVRDKPNNISYISYISDTGRCYKLGVVSGLTTQSVGLTNMLEQEEKKGTYLG